MVSQMFLAVRLILEILRTKVAPASSGTFSQQSLGGIQGNGDTTGDIF